MKWMTIIIQEITGRNQAYFIIKYTTHEVVQCYLKVDINYNIYIAKFRATTKKGKRKNKKEICITNMLRKKRNAII